LKHSATTTKTKVAKVRDQLKAFTTADLKHICYDVGAA